MDHPLLRGQRVRLVAVDPEADPAKVAAWSHDSEFLRLFAGGPARPWSPRQMKTDMEEILGKDEPKDNVFPFLIYALATPEAPERAIGMLDLDIPHWPQRDAWVAIAIGERALWGKGYGTEAMRLLLRYAFEELRLRRVSLGVFGYNERALKSYLKAGFKIEGRERERLRRNGQRWDMVIMGVLKGEFVWE